MIEVEHSEGATMGIANKVDAEQRRRMVAEAAYFRAERRGFSSSPDDELHDWVEAENEVDEQLRRIEIGHFADRIEECLLKANRKLSALRRKASKLDALARTECQRDAERLARLRDTLRHTQQQIREQGEHAGRRIREQAEKLWIEIGEIVSSVRARE